MADRKPPEPKREPRWWDSRINQALVGVGGAALGTHVVAEIARQAVRDPTFRAKLIAKAAPVVTKALPIAAVGMAAYAVGSAIYDAKKQSDAYREKQQPKGPKPRAEAPVQFITAGAPMAKKQNPTNIVAQSMYKRGQSQYSRGFFQGALGVTLMGVGGVETVAGSPVTGVGTIAMGVANLGYADKNVKQGRSLKAKARATDDMLLRAQGKHPMAKFRESDNRFRKDGTVNPNSPSPSQLTPYKGPKGANRPVGWGGEQWLKDNAQRLQQPGEMNRTFPEQFGPDGNIRPEYKPPGPGKQQRTGGVNGRLDAASAQRFAAADSNYAAMQTASAAAPVSGLGSSGWSDQARINAAISRGAQVLPYGGTPRDGKTSKG